MELILIRKLVLVVEMKTQQGATIQCVKTAGAEKTNNYMKKCNILDCRGCAYQGAEELSNKEYGQKLGWVLAIFVVAILIAVLK